MRDGHDGTWVAHPGLVPDRARDLRRSACPGRTSSTAARATSEAITAADLLARARRDAITEAGLRHNIRVGVQYLEAWLRGSGCVPLYNLMEDAATAEISRTQVWQWLRHGASLDDGRRLTRALSDAIRDEELAALRAQVGEAGWRAGRFERAAALFDALVDRTRRSRTS